MQPMQRSELEIGATLYQRPDVDIITTEIFIPTHKIGLNVFGEIFRSEKSRYDNNVCHEYGGVLFKLGDTLANYPIKVERAVCDRLLSISKSNSQSYSDQQFIQSVVYKYFPEKVRPSPKQIADHQKRLLEEHGYVQQRNDLMQVAAQKLSHEELTSIKTSTL